MFPRLITDLTREDVLIQTSDLNPTRMRDVLGRVKTAKQQNIFDADFEYGPQPLRWEQFVTGGATITHLPGEGGVRLAVPTTSGAIAIRQSRPYHRYQPGKSMFMATAALFGAAITNNRQRTGFFDDANGAFFEQGDPTATNPSGMGVVLRSDAGGVSNDVRIELPAWTGNSKTISQINWAGLQMIFVEYAWYGAGCIRFGAYLSGQPYILHQFSPGNEPGRTRAWARTGNLPTRYELRNVGAIAAADSFIHYGVSVCVEGGIDDQRGFTYSYGMAPTVPRRNVPLSTTRSPVLSVRGRVMGTQEYTQASSAITAGTTTSLTATGTPWTVDQFKGRALNYFVAGVSFMARITTNSTSALTLVDNVTGQALGTAPAAAGNYTIGLINRGQFLPRQLMLSSDSIAVIEVIASTPGNPVVLTGATFASLNTLGSLQSFAERDVSATAMTGGEVVFAFTAPAGGSGLQIIDLSNLFPLLNTIQGNLPDVLTLAVTTPAAAAANVGAHFIFQEAMS